MPIQKKNRLSLAKVLALSAALPFCIALSTPVSAAGGYGNCEVTGQKNSVKVVPVIPGQLTVRVGLPAPAWWNGDSPATIKDGYEYCMAANMAYRAGLDKIVVVNGSFAQLLGGQAKGFDLALTEASITEARKKTVLFSIPYYASDIGVLMKKGTKIDGQKLKTLRLGAYQGTTAVKFITDNIKPTQGIKVYPSSATMYAAIASNQVDAVLYDTANLLGKAQQSKGTLEVVGQYKTGESYGAIFNKDTVNEAAFNTLIKSLIDDGTLDKLSATYLAATWGADPAKIPYLTP